MSRIAVLNACPRPNLPAFSPNIRLLIMLAELFDRLKPRGHSKINRRTADGAKSAKAKGIVP